MQTKTDIEVKELSHSEIPLIANYWTQSDPVYLKSLGVDLEKVPTKEQLTSMLQHQIDLSYDKKGNYALILFVGDEAVGHTNINEIEYGKTAKMHLHIWTEKWRKQGIGTEMIQKAIPLYFEHFKLKKLLCEPFAENKAPNKTLEKVGFQFVKKYTTIPGSINFEQEVNQWQIER